jgi:hypothetical protein
MVIYIKYRLTPKNRWKSPNSKILTRNDDFRVVAGHESATDSDEKIESSLYIISFISQVKTKFEDSET